MRIHHEVGTILRVRGVLDPLGENPKTRPVVLVKALDADDEDDEALFLAVGVTGEFDTPVVPPCVALRFGKHGRCGTGLTKPSVANCGWRLVLPVTAIVERMGFVGDEHLTRILKTLRDSIK